MLRLLLIILFWPVIVWFYATIIGIVAVIIILTADVIQKVLPYLVGVFLLAYFSYLSFKVCRWQYSKKIKQLKRRELITAVTINTGDKFTPSTDLYCYWCTRKLGFKAWKKLGHYYCDECYKKGAE